LFSTLDIPKLDPPLFGLIKSGNFIFFITSSMLTASFFFIIIELGVLIFISFIFFLHKLLSKVIFDSLVSDEV